MIITRAEATAICRCSEKELDGCRRRAMPANPRRGLADDEFRTEEVVAVHVAVALRSLCRKQAEGDAFVMGLLMAFPLHEAWVVVAGPRRKLMVVNESQANLERRSPSARWVSPQGAFNGLRALGRRWS